MTVLASGQTSPSAIAVDDTNVYWSVSTTSPINPIAIKKCAIGGCGNNPTVLATTPGDTATRIITAGGMVYWTANASGIVACAATGCGGTPTSVTAGTTCSPVVGPMAMDPIAVEPRRIYFICNGGVAYCPRTGCNGQVGYINGGGGYDFATDGSHVFWADDYTTQSLYECIVTDCGQQHYVLAGGLTMCRTPDSVGAPLQLEVTDGVNVYWAENGATKCHLYAVGWPQVGCGPNNAPPTPLGAGCGHGLATDGQNVYWADDVTGLVKCSTAGCNGMPTALSSLHARAIALDATSVYWTDPSTSSVYKMPK